MLKTEGLGKKQIRIYETYNNTVMPHGRYIYANAYDTAKEKKLFILTVRSCVTTLEICIAILCQMSKH